MPRTPQPERRNAILAAAEDLFFNQGFDATQVSQIVQRIGAAQGTFYNYFTSKEEVLAAVFFTIWEQFVSAIESSAPAGPAAARLQSLLAGIFQPPAQATLAPERWQALNRLLAHPTAHNIWDDVRIQVLGPRIQQIVKAGVDEGTFKPYTCTAESVEVLFLGVNTYLHQHSHEFSDPQARYRHLTAIQEILIRSLGISPDALQFIPPTKG